MANRAAGTIQQYAASIRRFEEFSGMELGEVSQEMIRRWVDRLRQLLQHVAEANRSSLKSKSRRPICEKTGFHQPSIARQLDWFTVAQAACSHT